MKNRNKLRRCVNFLNRRKDEVLKNYMSKIPTEKEKVLLNYLSTLKQKLQEKNSTIQFIEHFIDEYGNKRNLTSSIIQLYLPFDKGKNYHDIYILIKNFFFYEVILHKKMTYILLPSASLIFDWKIADCFDLSNLAVSCLRTKNYEAYVVCGEAPLAICAKEDVTDKNWKINKDNYCTLDWKIINDKEEEEDKLEEIYEKKKKYKRLLNINKYLYFYSKWETSETKKYKQSDTYVHAWVLIKKSLDVKNDIFIEMSTGTEYAISNSPYKRIYFLWNDRNIYINTNKSDNINTLISEMKNTEYMVPAFFEEIKNKTLNPIVDANYFEIRKDRYLLKFPYGASTTFFGNCKKDEYGHLLQRDGLTEHHIHFITKNCVNVEYTCSFYKNRRDNKKTKLYFPQKYKTIEYYGSCSYQFLKKFERKTGFYSYFKFHPHRSDGLIHCMEVNGYKLMEYFKNRRDKIMYRSLRFSRTSQTPYVLKTYDGKDCYVEKIAVKYMDDEETPNCIYKKIFLIPEKKVILYFYNAENKIRNSCEVYEKRNVYNADREQKQEILIFKKNAIYENLINDERPLNPEVDYLINEEKLFFEEIKKNYENVICAILQKKKLIMEEEERQRYLEENVSNMHEIVYHNNEKIYKFNKDLLEDEINIYDFHETYPWMNNLDIGFHNSFFKSAENLVTVENYMDSTANDYNQNNNRLTEEHKSLKD